MLEVEFIAYAPAGRKLLRCLQLYPPCCAVARLSLVCKPLDEFLGGGLRARAWSRNFGIFGVGPYEGRHVVISGWVARPRENAHLVTLELKAVQ